MSSQVESASHGALMTSTHHMMGRTVPIIQASSPSAAPGPGEPMEVVNPPPVPAQAAIPSMGPPPARTSPELGANGANTSSDQGSTNSASATMPEQNQNGNMLAPSAAAGAQTGTGAPKVQQTAFIHKLYNMLDDATISHLITWSPTEDSFLMSPSNDFSKVLSQYFKHTNISSFVRQLNMYGFHKVSDVFHHGSAEAQLWEFKHGNGSFKRGDIAGLRDIKRRASRHALVHRDSYSTAKPPPYSQPGTPAEMAQSPMDSTDMRLAQLEGALYDMQYRAARNEEANNALHHKNQVLQEALARSLQVTSELSRIVQSTVPTHETVHRNVMDMQQEIDRQVSVLRNLDEPFEQLYSAAARQTYFSNHQDGHNGPPISPRQFAQDDHRRQALGQPRHALPHFNKAMPSHLSIQPRRYGSIGAQGGLSGTATPSPSSLRYQVGAPPPLPQQVSNLAIPAGANLARRHTSADIRVQTWPPNSAAYNDQAATPPVPSWQFSDRPSTPPVRAPFADPENQRIRESFSSYSFGSASMPKHSEQQSQIRASSRPSTPPFAPSNGGGLWNWGQQGNDKFGGNGNSSSSSAFGAGQHGAHSLFKENALNSGPPTRRGSMAHILNPAETAERNEDDEGRDDEDRKRKRLG